MQRYLVIATISLILLSLNAYPQDHFFSEGISINPTSFQTKDMALADVDNDGDLDIALLNLDAKSYLFLSHEGEPHPIPVWESIATTRSYQGIFIDYDLDGDMDLAIAADGQNLLFRNVNELGAPYLERSPVWASFHARQTTTVTAGDFNGDGYIDLAFGGYNSPLEIHLNQGGSYNSTPDFSTIEYYNTTSIVAGDLNSDGYADLVCSVNGTPSDIAFYMDPQGFPGIESWHSLAEDTSTCVALGDVNLDGALDAVYSYANSPPVLYLNVGDGLDNSQSWIPDFNQGDLRIELADVDLNARLDIITLGMDKRLRVYLNKGSISREPDWQTEDAYMGATNLDVADISGDNTPEIFLSVTSAPCLLFKNLSLIFSSTPDWFSPVTTDAVDMAVFESDGEPGSEFIVAGAKQGLNLYRDLFSEPIYLGNPGVISVIEVGNIAQQGGINLFVGTVDDFDYLYSLNDRGFAPELIEIWRSELATTCYAALAADFTGDGYEDLALASRSCCNTSISILDWHYLPSAPREHWRIDMGGAGIVALVSNDIDNDGVLELLAGYDAGVAVIKPFAEPSEVLQELPFDALKDIAASDIDGDGWLDAVIGQGDSISVHLNQQGMLSGKPAWTIQQIMPERITCDDMDNNGFLDIIAATATGDTIIFNHGGELSEPSIFKGEAEVASVGLDITDLDGDGLRDMIFIGNGTASRAYLSRMGIDAMLPDDPGVALPVAPPRGNPVTGTLLIDYLLVDAQSDLCFIYPEYCFIGHNQWFPAAVGVGGDGLYQLTSSPAGILHRFAWDTDADDLIGRAELRIRVKAPGSQARSTSQYHDQVSNMGTFNLRAVPGVMLYYPAAGQADDRDIDLVYALSELCSEVAVVFEWEAGAQDINAPHRTTVYPQNGHSLPLPMEVGFHHVKLMGDDLRADGEVSSDDHLVPGAVYTVNLEAKDTSPQQNSWTCSNSGWLYHDETLVLMGIALQDPVPTMNQATENLSLFTNQDSLQLTIRSQGYADTVCYRISGMDGYRCQRLYDYNMIIGIEDDEAGPEITVHCRLQNSPYTATQPRSASITRDKAPPFPRQNAIITINGNAACSGGEFQVAWTPFDDDIAGIEGYYWDRVDLSGSAGGNWIGDENVTVLSGFAQGENSIYIWAQDRAGNISDSISINFIVDNTPPEIVGDAQLIIEEGSGTICCPKFSLCWNPGAFIDPDYGVLMYEIKMYLDGELYQVKTAIEPRQVFEQVGDGFYCFELTALNCAMLASEATQVCVTLDCSGGGIFVGGYWDSEVIADRESLLKVIAINPLRKDGIIELFYQGSPLGLYLNDAGLGGDEVAGDGVFTLFLPLPAVEGALKILLELNMGNRCGYAWEQNRWPYLHVQP